MVGPYNAKFPLVEIDVVSPTSLTLLYVEPVCSSAKTFIIEITGVVH